MVVHYGDHMFDRRWSLLKGPIIAEFGRLLDMGELLLAVFPRQCSDGWLLQLPGNISWEMVWYAQQVALRERDLDGWREGRESDPLSVLRGKVGVCDAGLVGWRALGVIN